MKKLGKFLKRRWQDNFSAVRKLRGAIGPPCGALGIGDFPRERKRQIGPRELPARRELMR
jgi:hypothetical protein